MSNYVNEIIKIENVNFQKMVEISRNKLPEHMKPKPWSFINHGIGLLQTEDELNCYLAAYGEMHENKIKKSLEALYNPEQIFNNDIQIIDWGCGQGLATVCLFDFLIEKNLPNKIKKIILIEPSNQALNRAKININKYLYDETKIKTVNKFLNDVNSNDIVINQPVTLHFFSNILDITTIDLQRLANIINDSLIGENYFFCVGPLNIQSKRIEEFAKHLSVDKENVIRQNQGKLITTRGTIKLLIFRIKGKEIEIIKTDYYPPIPNNINYKYMIEKILRQVNPANLNELDKIIEFYKTVVELEQQKEPDIKAFYPYPITRIENNIISLDIANNQNFFEEFNINSDPAETRWPKDVFVGLIAVLDDKTYTLFNQIIPFDDIRDIDITNQNIPINISSFEIYLKTLRELELTEEQIADIEEAVSKTKSLDEIKTLIEEKIDGINFDDNNIYLALSSKNPSLSQIYSELRRINKHIQKDSLVEKFLLFKKVNNRINNLKEEDLVQVSALDQSQKKAVLSAFNNKLSVITGPPGSGKTQVILNILANALLQNKKVLVASKNNKAVDNVKERFDNIDKTGYFLRFGSKKILNEMTLPEIERIINLKPTLEDNSNLIENLKSNLENHRNVIKRNKDELRKRNNLQKEIPEIENKIKSLEQQIDILKENNQKLDFFRQSYNIEELDAFISQLKIKMNDIYSKYSGIKKLFFNWFSKKKYAREILNIIEQYPYDIKKYIQSQNFKSQVNDFKNGDDILFLYSSIIEIFNNATNYICEISKLNIKLKRLSNELEKNIRIIEEITNREPDILSEIKNSKEELIKLGKPFVTEIIKSKIKNLKVPIVNNYKHYLPNSIPYRYDEIPIFFEETKAFLNNFNIISVTSLSAKAAFPLENELFDMVVIDEASQCDIPSAIPLALRTKQLVVIGDPLQLKHISLIKDEEEKLIKEKILLNKPFLNYYKKSLWDYSKELLALSDDKPVMIDSHYRCHPNIIGYSNEAFYLRYLGRELTVNTNSDQYILNPKGIIWIDVQGEQRANNININNLEVEKAIEKARNLALSNPSISIGIITPFRHQADILNRNIPEQLRNRIVADTVYKFQGDEKDVIIYSLVVTDNSPDSKIHWIDYSVPNLVNVAVTRARNTLYIVGNKEYIRRKSSLTKPLGKLVEYVERN